MLGLLTGFLAAMFLLSVDEDTEHPAAVRGNSVLDQVPATHHARRMV